MILDTSFLIDVMNADDAALGKVDEIEADGVEQNVPAMTLQELYIGIGASDSWERERRKVEYVVESRPILPTTVGDRTQGGTHRRTTLETGRADRRR